MSPQIYPAVYYGFLLLLACLYVFTYARAGNDFVYKRSLCNGNRLGVIIVTLLCALFLGTRPIDPFFSDTVTYATWYKHIQIVSQDFLKKATVVSDTSCCFVLILDWEYRLFLY